MLRARNHFRRGKKHVRQEAFLCLLTITASRLFVPVGEDCLQHIYVIDKDEHGNVIKKKEYDVQYVPLTDAPVE